MPSINPDALVKFVATLSGSQMQALLAVFGYSDPDPVTASGATGASPTPPASSGK